MKIKSLILLIEEKINIFYILCQNCLDIKKYKINTKKIECKELLLHYLNLYDNGEKENILDNLNKTTNDLLKIKDEISSTINHFEIFKKHISIIEEVLKYYSLPLSLQKKVEEKLIEIKKDNIIKNKIIEYYKEFKHFIIIENVISILYN